MSSFITDKNHNLSIEFEHVCSSYSSTKDPVNMAGFVAENLLLNRLKIFYWNEFENFDQDDKVIDVRTKPEYEKEAWFGH
jgi:hypothetical protein